MKQADTGRLFEVEKYKERLHIALKSAKICVFEVDLKRQLYTFFENAEDIFGVSGEVILQEVKPFSALSPDEYQQAVTNYFSHPGDANTISKAFQSIFSGKPVTYQARMRAGGSDFLWCKLDITPILEDGVPVKMIGVITDVNDINQKINRLEKAANIDSFTRLSNKGYAIESIKKVLEEKPGLKHALVLLDIDHFKAINDTYGHDVGDLMIGTVASLLKEIFRKTDCIGRFGGDEFILLLQDIPNTKWIAQKMLPLLRCENGQYRCTNSIGISIYPKDGTNYEALFKSADIALYRSKQANETFTFYSALDAQKS